MQKTVTLEDVVLFAYNEVPDSQECELIFTAIKYDSTLYSLYLEVTESIALIASMRGPSEKTIRNILDYAQKMPPGLTDIALIKTFNLN